MKQFMAAADRPFWILCIHFQWPLTFKNRTSYM